MRNKMKSASKIEVSTQTNTETWAKSSGLSGSSYKLLYRVEQSHIELTQISETLLHLTVYSNYTCSHTVTDVQDKAGLPLTGPPQWERGQTQEVQPGGGSPRPSRGCPPRWGWLSRWSCLMVLLPWKQSATIQLSVYCKQELIMWLINQS